MALPPGISTGAVTFGQAVSLIGGGDTTMTIEIKPTHNVVHAATGIQLLDFAETMTLAEGVPGSITLPHTDQTGFIDSSGNAFQGWAYVATGNWRRGSETRAFTKRFQILLGQNTIDLDLLPNGQITVPVTAPVMPVTSFLGLTGPIVEEDLEGLELGGVADGSVDEVKLDPAVVTKIDGKLDAVDAADFITETQADASYAPVSVVGIDPDAVGFDLIAGLGQSEMVGQDNSYDVARTDFTNTRVSQYAYSGSFAGRVVLAADPLGHQSVSSGLGPLTRFARLYAASVPTNRSVLIVPSARNGTGFGADADGTWLASGGVLLDNAIAQMNAAYAAAGANAKWGCILWWQGQHDGALGWSAETYAGHFDAMIARIKAEVAGMNADTPVVVMQMNAEFRRGDYAPVPAAGAALINDAHVDTPRRLTRSGFAYGPGLGYGMGDGLHTNAEGTRRHVPEAFNAYRRAIYNVLGSAALPPSAPRLTQVETSLNVTSTCPLARYTAINYRYRTGTGAWTTLTRTSVMDANAVITGLTLTTTYEVQAQTVNEEGSSAWSASATITMVDVPGQVIGLAAGVATGSTQALTWTAKAGATSYQIQYKAESSSTWLVAGTSTTTSFTVSGLTHSTSYDYRVAAVNAAGAGLPSTRVTVSTGELSATVGDNFNRADGLLGVTSLGNKTWSVAGTGTYGIVSNQAKITGGTAGGTVALVPCDLPTGVLKATLKAVSGAPATMISGISIRTASISSGITVALRSSSSLAEWCLVNRSGSAVLAQSGVAPVAGDQVRVEMTATDIIVKVNGATLITYPTTLYNTVATHGLYGHASDLVSAWDDFEYIPA